MKKSAPRHLFIYELRNCVGNIYGIAFGGIFPIFLTILFIAAFSPNAGEYKDKFATHLFLVNTTMAPLALMFVGFGAMMAQEIENGILTRINLFGFSYSRILRAKLLSYMGIMTILFLVYTIVICSIYPIIKPSAFGLVVFLVSYYILGFLLFVLAYAIALILGRFGPTYGIMMFLYFGTMVLSGMMGVQSNVFPAPIRFISKLLPTTYFTEILPKLWTRSSYNITPMVQSYLLLAAVTGIILFISLNKNKKTL